MVERLLCYDFGFFFQAEDGIRDWSVTGVQTCALPIYTREGVRAMGRSDICIVVGVTDKPNQQELRRAGWESQSLLLPEHFELNAKPGLVCVLGGDSRGLVYALSQLRRSVRLEHRLPASLVLKRKPL